MNTNNNSKIYYLTERIKVINELKDILPSDPKERLHKCVVKTRRYTFLNDYIDQYLILHPDEINNQNQFGQTALMLSSKNTFALSTERTVEILLKHNANVNIQDNKGKTAIFYAVKSLKYDARSLESTVEILLKHSANLSLKYKGEMLPDFFFPGRRSVILNIIKILTDGKFKTLYDRTPDGNNALMYAMYQLYYDDYNVKIIKKLLSFGFNIDVQNDEGDTVLREAMCGTEDLQKNFTRKILKLLMKHNPNVNIINIDDSTPITIAILNHKEWYGVTKILMPNRKIFIKNIKENKKRIISGEYINFWNVEPCDYKILYKKVDMFKEILTVM